MGEANAWHKAVKEALQFQSRLITMLHNRVTKLEEKLNENTNQPADRPQVIHGITGAQYVAQVFKGPDGVPKVQYPVVDS